MSVCSLLSVFQFHPPSNSLALLSVASSFLFSVMHFKHSSWHQHMAFLVWSLFCSVWLHVRMVSVPSVMVQNHCHQCITTQWLNTLILPFYWKKKKFYTFLGTWSGFALPRRQFPVLISLKVWIFFDLLRFFGVLWLIFFSFLPLLYTTIYQSNTNWFGIAINITTVSIFTSGQLWRRHSEGNSLSCSCFTLV